MYGYVYKTTNKVNKKIYIGQHKGEYDKSYYGSGLLIGRAFRKYGVENFENEVIEWCETREKLNEREIYWIEKYNSFYNMCIGYNIAKGGNMGNLRCGYTKEEVKNWRNKISISKKGCKISNEHKLKIKKSLTGVNNFKEYQKNNNSMLGRKHSQATKDKISALHKGIPHTDEHKEKIRKSMLNKTTKPVTVIYENKTYSFRCREDAVMHFRNIKINVASYLHLNYNVEKLPKKYKGKFEFIGYSVNLK